MLTGRVVSPDLTSCSGAVLAVPLPDTPPLWSARPALTSEGSRSTLGAISALTSVFEWITSLSLARTLMCSGSSPAAFALRALSTLGISVTSGKGRVVDGVWRTDEDHLHHEARRQRDMKAGLTGQSSLTVKEEEERVVCRLDPMNATESVHVSKT